MFKINFSALLLFTLISGCTEEKRPKPAILKPRESIFPKTSELSLEKDNTAFATTLESEIDLSKNAIYAATMLFCWDKFEKQFGEAKDISRPELRILNESKSYRNSLKEDEQTISLITSGRRVTITSIFDVKLPFKEPLNKLNGEFKGTKIKAFGKTGGDHQVQIIYYNSDTDFALRLLPENNEHEIIICQRDFSRLNSLKQQFLSIQSEEKKFRINAANWMKNLNEKDELSIPQLGFSLETRFKGMEGATFNTRLTSWMLIEAYQNNALSMNENGASVYSKAVMIMDMMASRPAEKEKVKVPVKHLLVNSNYVVFFKRKDCNWPYFGAFIANTRWIKSK